MLCSQLLLLLLAGTTAVRLPASTASFTRRALLGAIAVSGSAAPAKAGFGGYDDASGSKSYSQVQRAWESSSGKSQREVMMELRGASLGRKQVDETAKSRKRRAMAGCKDDLFRREARAESEASCNSRVLSGEMQFMLDVLDAG